MSDASMRQQLRGIRIRLNRLRMPELRTVLVDMNLSRTGRKSELVERIAQELEACANMARSAVGSHTASSTFYSDQMAVGLASIERQMNPPHAPPMGTGMPYNNQIPPIRYTTAPVPSHRAIGVYNRHSLQGRMPEAHPAVSYGAMGTSPVGAPGSGVIPLSSGVDLYNPTKVAALDDARCFCAMQGISGKVVKCVDCGLTVHAKCHQLITLVGEWYCELCRAKIYDPFFSVQKTVLEPNFVRFAKHSSSFRIEYYITDSDINSMYSKRDAKPGCMTPGSLELQLRCFQLKEDLAAGHCWPACTQLNVNGFGVPITQRAPPGHANPSKVLRELPANIFQFSRVGRNVIDVRTTENPAVFAFMVQIVEVRNITDLVDEVKEASKHLTYESAKQEIIKSFGSEDEDDIVATCTMLSVRCPLGLCVINLPARGLYCKHLQCFDLRTFMLFSKKARSKAWRCTVCHKFIKAADLRIDPYLKQLLADVAGEDELEEVEIFPDGSWKRRVDEELIPVPPAKRVKTEQSSVVGTSANGSGTSASASTTTTTTTTTATATTSTSGASRSPSASSNGAAGSSAATPFEIDLSLSSDEEEEESTQPTRSTADTTAASSAAPAATSSSATILLDDDIDILTVNSDAWDAPARSSGGNMATSTGTDDYADFPFSLDESLFPSSSTNSSNTSASSWMSSIVSSMPPPTTTTTATEIGLTSTAGSSTVSPPSEFMSQPESNLANSMASLSRNHPNVSNPFERPQRQTRPPPKPTAPQNDLDIICLLDSDSD